MANHTRLKPRNIATNDPMQEPAPMYAPSDSGTVWVEHPVADGAGAVGIGAGIPHLGARPGSINETTVPANTLMDAAPACQTKNRRLSVNIGNYPDENLAAWCGSSAQTCATVPGGPSPGASAMVGGRRRQRGPRGYWVLAHRWAGLALALFLTIAGLTGSIIAFHTELDAWLNPDWFWTGNTDAPLPTQQLVDRLEAADPRLRVVYVPLDTEPGRAARIQVEARTASPEGTSAALGFDELFVDPANAAVLGQRQWGSCCLGRREFVPFVYVLHHSLHLPGEYGRLLMGTVALVWAFDCLVGLYLTFPRPGNRTLAADGPPASQPHGHRRRAAADWWRRWRKAWTIKRGVGGKRINWDLHRALGLWFWVLLTGMAVSGVSLNLQDEVFEPVVSWFSAITPSPFDEREEAPPGEARAPGLSFTEAIEAAGAEAHRRGWEDAVNGVFYNAAFAIYGVHFGAEDAPGLGPGYVYVDAADGSVLGVHKPGEGSPGDLIADIQFPLHSGRIAGLPGRLAIAATGIAVAVLSVTGVIIWLGKRQSRRRATAKP